MKKSLREKLLSKTRINWETGCWEWTGGQDHGGYGQQTVESTTLRAHRAVYELWNGPIPAGLQLDHLCRVRRCVNPAHLEPVTSRENTLRAPASLAALNVAKTHCAHGHEYTPENTYVRPNGKRRCRACERRMSVEYRIADPARARAKDKRYRDKKRAAAELAPVVALLKGSVA